LAKVTIEQLQKKIRSINQEKIIEYKTPITASMVSCFWKDLSLYETYKIQESHFSDDKENNAWRVYWVIAREIAKEGVKKLSETEIELYLDKHKKLLKVYEESGGYETLQDLMTYTNLENIDSYINNFNKYYAMEKLNEKNWITPQQIKKYSDYELDDIYRLHSAHFNDIFINSSSKIKTYNLCSGLNEIVEKADKGLIAGIPLANAPTINDMIGGSRLGEIIMLGGISGSGKTTTMISWLFPTALENNGKLCVILNEQGIEKMRREIITYVANNIFNGNFNKARWTQGKFTDEEKKILLKSTNWLEEKEKNKNIIIIPLEKYTVDIVIKLIKKYSAMGVDSFALDTMKPSTDADTAIQWQEMQKDSVKIYDTIKTASCNVRMWINLQLSKSVAKHRFLGLDSIGLSKNVVDIASTFIAMRSLWNLERQGGKKEVQYIYKAGEDGKTTIKETVPEFDHVNYSIFFIPKSREGSGGNHQVFARNNLGLNTFEELGLCYIDEDWG